MHILHTSLALINLKYISLVAAIQLRRERVRERERDRNRERERERERGGGTSSWCTSHLLQPSNLEMARERAREGGSRSSVRCGSTLLPAMKPADCSLLIFGLTVSSVLDSASDQRDLDVVELWSGVEAIVSAARAAGFTAMPFDKFRIEGATDTDDPDTTEDILLEAGFRRALNLVLRVCAGGLVWMAPVCSSWIFLNLKNTKRTKVAGPRFGGNRRYLPVQHGNRMAEMAAFLFLVAVARGVHVVIENPAGSMMFNYEVFASTCGFWPERFWAILPHCRYSTEPFGLRLGKKFKLMCSHAWVLQLACKCLCPGRKHQQLCTMKTVRGKRTVTGLRQALRDSAAYPKNMGIAVIQAWMNKANPEKSQGPRSKARTSGPRSSVHAVGCGKKQDVKKSWATLELDESLARSSSSSRAPAQRRPRAISSSQVSARRRPHWQTLDLDEAVNLDTDARRAARTTMTWRSLDLEECDDPPEPQQSRRWQTLSFDE